MLSANRPSWRPPVEAASPRPLTNSGELAESVVFLITGPRLDVIATSSDDTIEVHAGLQTHRILVNHVAYYFSASEITQIEIQAGEGSDTVVLHGTSIADRADIWPGASTFTVTVTRSM